MQLVHDWISNHLNAVCPMADRVFFYSAAASDDTGSWPMAGFSCSSVIGSAGASVRVFRPTVRPAVFRIPTGKVTRVRTSAHDGKQRISEQISRLRRIVMARKLGVFSLRSSKNL